MTTLVQTRAALAAALAEGAAAGRSRAVVMTMGALHAGHLSLVRLASEHADEVVATVFVNPLQFGPGEDLDSYPRDLDGDVALLTAAGADLVFAPEVAEMYDGEPVVTVSAGSIGTILEGASRPGHLDGVLTVVLKLLHLTSPNVAVFGEKDAQQLMAVRQMVADLDVPVQIVGAPIVRDEDGLALSSRNAYLSAAERAAALALPAAIAAGTATAGRGGTARGVVDAARDRLSASSGLLVDYVALVDPRDATDVPADHRGPALLAIAARAGATRLIDNAMVDIAPEEER
ncbi:pantoate--beta-alanine ligase [Actinotalea sp.]|uniref:pantoate--beta-alanine ligase n=1 Tax=Actinotalea sp. TaxID=1872145 RepID=UPI0035679848